MVRLEAADLVDDAAVVPPLKFSEAGNNESGVRNSINIRDVQGIRGGVEYGLYSRVHVSMAMSRKFVYIP